MAVYKLFPIQDNTIYSAYPTMNAGLDPILEINNLLNYGSNPQIARSLIKFDQEEIDNVINNIVSGSSFDAFLKLYTSKIEGITEGINLDIFPISGSWVNGNGQFMDNPLNPNGSSWVYQDYENNILWNVGTTQSYVSSSFPLNNPGGATWFSSTDNINNPNISVSQSFDSRTYFDLNVNVSDIVKTWYSSSNNLNGSYINITNEGFIIKLDGTMEFNTSSSFQPLFNYFSVDTNTIYPPCLEIRWDDSVYNTGSLKLISSPDIFIGLSNNPGIFYQDSINQFEINVRPDFPNRIYQTSSLYTNNQALPLQSYYAVKDLDTEEYVVNFDDNYTKISCNNNTNYFNLYMNGLEPERNYKILIKTIINGSCIIKDNNYYFKIVR